MSGARRFDVVEHLSEAELDMVINEAQKADEAIVHKVSFEHRRFTVKQHFFTVIRLSRDMPPDGYTSITVPDEVFEQLTEVMVEYKCESLADAVEAASVIALECDETALAQLLARQLTE